MQSVEVEMLEIGKRYRYSYQTNKGKRIYTEEGVYKGIEIGDCVIWLWFFLEGIGATPIDCPAITEIQEAPKEEV